MYYKYKVVWYNSYDDKEEEDEGLLYAHDYGAAANGVVRDYGEDSVVSVYLSEIYSDCDGFCISKSEIDSTFQTKDE